MALRVCPECTESVSERAIQCPHCGYPTRGTATDLRRSGALVAAIGAALFFGAGIGYAIKSRPAPPTPPAASAAAANDECECDCDHDSTDVDDDEATDDRTPSVSAERILQDAQDAYVHGQYARAIDLAKQTVASEPVRAWRVIGAADCFLHDRKGAQLAWSKLGKQERAFLQYVCGRNEVALP